MPEPDVNEIDRLAANMAAYISKQVPPEEAVYLTIFMLGATSAMYKEPPEIGDMLFPHWVYKEFNEAAKSFVHAAIEARARKQEASL